MAAEYWGWHVPTGTTGVVANGGVPTFPTYTLRVGVADRLEVGARIANMSSLGADFKWNFVKGRTFDAAIDPAFQFFHLSTGTSTSTDNADSSVNVVYLHAPLLLGINFNEILSLVLTPGIAYGFASATVQTNDARDSASGTTGVMGRFGVGLDVRVFDGFALHPEITFLRTFKSDAALIYMAGLCFNFGKLPSYADVEGPAPKPAE